jgi:ADP-heptose:LPS heptosyltransferase
MINFFLRHKVKKINSLPPNLEDIKKSNKILFSIFTRYGDTIISLEVIKEFIAKYPEKEYLILCPRQMLPYVQELLPLVECITLNKRNIFELIKVVKVLKKKAFDIGFNPWSNGLDSCYLISHSVKFLFYKDFDRPSEINHYQVVRRYLKLAEMDWTINNLNLKKNYAKILICPQSTDSTRNLSNNQLDQLIGEFILNYDSPQITIASDDKNFLRHGCKFFCFEKTPHSSRNFLELVKNNTLIVSADSGPMHIALALKKDLIAIMKSTKPKLVLNSGSYLKVMKFQI